jgi:hypothetical protein
MVWACLQANSAASCREGHEVNHSEVREVVRAIAPIEGWLSAEAAQLFALLDAVQARAGIVGDLFEIGVKRRPPLAWPAQRNASGL